MIVLVLYLFLFGVNVIHCQDHLDILAIMVKRLVKNQEVILNNLKDIPVRRNEILNKLEGFEEAQQKHNEILDSMKDYEDILLTQREMLTKLKGFEETQKKQNEILGKLAEMQEKLATVEITVEDELSKAISTDNMFNFTCSCPPGFESKGLNCVDVDECIADIDDCSPNASCINSLGSYSCVCNAPFVGDGQICTESRCKRPAKVIEGLGCIWHVEETKTWHEMEVFCEEHFGGRILQDFKDEHLKDIAMNFGDYSFGWIGTKGNKWSASGIQTPAELWHDGYPDLSLNCGMIGGRGTDAFKLFQVECSEKDWGFCQVLI